MGGLNLFETYLDFVTIDTSTFFLSASAFIHPFEHLIQDETKRMVQGYLAFLNDNTNLISNPGILVSTPTPVDGWSRC